MATAIEKVCLGRGYDPRDFTVIGYGGGSGLFIAEVCRDLGIEKLVMPRAAATFSAYGLLFADAIHAESTTAQWIYEAGSVDEINALYDSLQEKAVEAMRREGYADEDISVRREADVKFAGQSFEISMTWPEEPVADGDREQLGADFVDEYERTYGPGSAWDGFPIELHTARVVASGRTAKPPLGSVDDQPLGRRAGRRARGDPRRQRADRGGLRRRRARAGQELRGPAIVDDVDTTLLRPRGRPARGRRDAQLRLLDRAVLQPEASPPTATAVAS